MSDKQLKQPQQPNKQLQQPQQSKAKLKYFPSQVNQSCQNCEDISKQFESYKASSERQFNTLLEILAEHKVLLDRLVSQNAVINNLMDIFPIKSVEKLKEFDNSLATQADPYKRHIRTLLGGNTERNLHQVFGQEIIMNFNVDGSFGKQRLRDYGNRPDYGCRRRSRMSIFFRKWYYSCRKCAICYNFRNMEDENDCQSLLKQSINFFLTTRDAAAFN